jgi:predicted  nucleic acid-binding Zn-ribbon protein
MTSGRNRITELEGTVDELQSTVRGLTEELVEANQRIRDLEDALEERDADEASETDAYAEEDKSAESQDSGTETGESETKTEDDIIVA